jgi:hypothetical protein
MIVVSHHAGQMGLNAAAALLYMYMHVHTPLAEGHIAACADLPGGYCNIARTINVALQTAVLSDAHAIAA